MVFKFNTGKSTKMFQIALSKLIDSYPKIEDWSLSLHYFKKYLKMIKVFNENTSEFLNR